MGSQETKLANPKANVINEVVLDQKENGWEEIKIYLIIITVVAIIELALKVYRMHNKRIKKRYIGQTNEVERI